MNRTLLFAFFIFYDAAMMAGVFPKQKWITQKLDAGSLAVARDLDRFLFDSKHNSKTDGVLVVKDGFIFHERYKKPFGEDKKHIAWSVAKSYLNALVGIAVAEGRLSLDASICQYGYHRNCQVTIRSLLYWASGLKWNESYEKIHHPSRSNVLSMLYGKNRYDMANYVSLQEADWKPMTRYRYSSGDSNLLSGVLRNVYGPDYESLVFEKLLGPIGSKNLTWERDQSGTFIASSYVYATARDLARLGYLYLQRGRWDGHVVLPASWVDYTTQVPPESVNLEGLRGTSIPGAHWWLNKSYKEGKLVKRWESVPEDVFFAAGHWGQYIFVFPSHNLVVVRIGDNRKRTFEVEKFLGLVFQLGKTIRVKGV